MKYWVVKRACEGCSINFDPDLIICQDCDPQRYRYCFDTKRKNVVVSQKANCVLHEGEA